MNVEAYNLDSLRKIVRELQKENTMLKERLQKANIPFETSDPFVETMMENEKYDLDQGGRIEAKMDISDDDAKRFFAMFWGRTDVYAKRGKKGGYFPQCDNRWNDSLCPKQKGQKQICDDCNHKCWSKLELYQIKAHLAGKKDDGADVIGVYPLLPDGTCRFLSVRF